VFYILNADNQKLWDFSLRGFLSQISEALLHNKQTMESGNTKLKGRLNTVDLLIKAACCVKQG